MKLPIDALQPFIDRLQAPPFGPLIDALLFVVLLVAAGRAVFLLLGRPSASDVRKAFRTFGKLFPVRRGYEPLWETHRRRWEPYFSFVGSLYFAFGGLYSTTLVTLAMLASTKDVAWYLYAVGSGIALAGLYYMRFNLEEASWAHARIREQRRPGGA